MTTSTAGPDAGSATRPRRAAAAPLPIALAVTGVLITGLAAYVDTLTTAAERDAVHAGRGALTAVTGTVLMLSAAVILRSRPRHRVGVVLAVFGLVWAVDGLLESWSALAFADGLPGVDVAVWFVARFGAFLLLGLPLLLVLYPTGHLVEGRWRVASLATVVAAASLPVMLLLAPDAVVFRDLRVPGVDTELVALPLSEDAVVALLVVTRFLTLLALLGALVIAFARHRRADGLQRTQLRWLLWAGIVCVLTVPVLVVAPSGTVTGIVLAAAVVLTAISVTVGVVRPDLADVDALVAGTLTYAGVAGLVVALDLLILAVGGALLGDRLDERNVTLVVLVLAVGVYGPLRAWVGAAVRRMLFGRRGDRYDVVSAFAARLEETRSVDEQLPALAGAVASTFKVPFVRVELSTPDGGTVSASHGTADGAGAGDRHRLHRRAHRSAGAAAVGGPLDAVAAGPGAARRPGPPGGDRDAQQPARRRGAGEPGAAGARPGGRPPADPPRPARRARAGARGRGDAARRCRQRRRVRPRAGT